MFRGEVSRSTGGLPMRLAPYFYILSAIRRLNASGHSALVYVHPWEFDLEQPRITLPWSRQVHALFQLAGDPTEIRGTSDTSPVRSVREVLVD